MPCEPQRITRGDAPIVCGEWGTPEPQRWSDPVRFTPAEHQAVRRHERDGLLQTREAGAPAVIADWHDAPLFAGVGRDGRLRVAGTDFVGVITLPGGRRISIRPKVGGLALLDWLAWLGECTPVAGWLRDSPQPLREGGPLEPALAALYLGELESLTRLHFRKQYVPRRRDAATVRGKLLTAALARQYHRLPALPQRSPERTWDTPHHALLAAALDRVPLLLSEDEWGGAGGVRSPGPEATRPRLSRLTDAWSVVARPPPADLARLILECGQSPPPPGYAPAVRLAALVLSGAVPDLRGDRRALHAAGPAFLLSVAGVWERAVRRMCRDLAAGTGWEPVPDPRRTRRWHDGAGAGPARDSRPPPGPPRWMTADALLESARGRWVLDAKYKLGFGDEDRADRFQAAAYAVAFDAGRGSLVYPSAQGTIGRRRVLLAGEVAGRPVTIDSIELPMSAGPHACRDALGVLIRGDAAPSAG